MSPNRPPFFFLAFDFLFGAEKMVSYVILYMASGQPSGEELLVIVMDMHPNIKESLVIVMGLGPNIKESLVIVLDLDPNIKGLLVIIMDFYPTFLELATISRKPCLRCDAVTPLSHCRLRLKGFRLVNRHRNTPAALLTQFIKHCKKV